MYSVRFLDFKRLYTHYEGLDEAIRRCLITGKLILQEDTEAFESNFAEYLGVDHVVTLNSGTDALMMSLIAAGVAEGDEVITVSHTFIATIQAIHQLGATPILVDVDENGVMEMGRAMDAITDKTKAIIPVHLTGLTTPIIEGDVPFIIEDAAQAIGAADVGFGKTQCYSFYPAKILGTFGDAGALATNDTTIADRVRSLRNHGGVTKYTQDSYEYGWNSRLDNVWAAVLNEKLQYLDRDIARRKEIAEYYLDEFRNLPLTLPLHTTNRVWQDFVIRTENPKSLAAQLADKGVETLGIGMVPNHHHKGLGLDHFSLPMTEEITAQQLRIPCNHLLTDNEVKYVSDAVKQSV